MPLSDILLLSPLRSTSSENNSMIDFYSSLILFSASHLEESHERSLFSEDADGVLDTIRN